MSLMPHEIRYAIHKDAMTRVLLTGGHGFIGTHLKNRLKPYYKVDILPRRTLQNKMLLWAWLGSKQYDYIFHLASYGNHSFQVEHDKVYKANVDNLFNLIDATRHMAYKGFFNFSTTHHNLEAGSFYGSTKSAGEYIVRAFVRNYGLKVVNVRPYSVFGEYEWDFRFLPTISRQIANGEPITVSDVTHDWIYVEDFIDGLLSVVKDVNNYVGKSVGIGTGERVSNLFLAQKLMEIVGKTVPILNGVKRSYEIAAYGKELINKTEEEKQEIFISQTTTPFEVSLKRVYDSSPLWLKR